MKARGVPEAELPPAPNIDRQWLWIWRAWHRLAADRPQHGGGMGPAVPGMIPYMAVRAWAEDHNMTRGEFAMLDALLREMDKEYLLWWQSKQPPPRPPPARSR